MNTELRKRELETAQHFIRSAASGIDERSSSMWIVSFALAIIGLILGGYATLLFLSHPTDHSARYVLLPGGGMGFLLAITGALIPQFAARATERKEIAAILKKLLS